MSRRLDFVHQPLLVLVKLVPGSEAELLPDDLDPRVPELERHLVPRPRLPAELGRLERERVAGAAEDVPGDGGGGPGLGPAPAPAPGQQLAESSDEILITDVTWGEP